MVRLFKLMTTVLLLASTLCFAMNIAQHSLMAIVTGLLTIGLLLITIRVSVTPSSFDDGKKYFSIPLRISVCLRRCLLWCDAYETASTMVGLYNLIVLNEEPHELADGKVEVGNYGFHRVRAYGPQSTKEIFMLRNLKEAK